MREKGNDRDMGNGGGGIEDKERKRGYVISREEREGVTEGKTERKRGGESKERERKRLAKERRETDKRTDRHTREGERFV